MIVTRHVVKVDGVPIFFGSNKTTRPCAKDKSGKWVVRGPNEFRSEADAEKFIDLWKVRKAVVEKIEYEQGEVTNISEMAFA